MTHTLTPPSTLSLITNQIIQLLQCRTIFQFPPLHSDRKSLWKPLLPDMPSLNLHDYAQREARLLPRHNLPGGPSETEGWSTGEPPASNNRETTLAGGSLASGDQQAVSRKAALGKAGWKKGVFPSNPVPGSLAHPQTPGLACRGRSDRQAGSSSAPRGLPPQTGADGTAAATAKTSDQVCQDTVTPGTAGQEAWQKAHTRSPASLDVSRGPRRTPAGREERGEARRVTREDHQPSHTALQSRRSECCQVSPTSTRNTSRPAVAEYGNFLPAELLSSETSATALPQLPRRSWAAQDLRGWLTGQANAPHKCAIFHLPSGGGKVRPATALPLAPAGSGSAVPVTRAAALPGSSHSRTGLVPSCPGQLSQLLSLSRLGLSDACQRHNRPFPARQKDAGFKEDGNSSYRREDSAPARGAVPSGQGLVKPGPGPACGPAQARVPREQLTPAPCCRLSRGSRRSRRQKSAPEPADGRARAEAGSRMKTCVHLSPHDPGQGKTAPSQAQHVRPPRVPCPRSPSTFVCHRARRRQMSREIGLGHEEATARAPAQEDTAGTRPDLLPGSLSRSCPQHRCSPQPGARPVGAGAGLCPAPARCRITWRGTTIASTAMQPALQRGGAWRRNTLLPTRRCAAQAWA